MEKVLKIDRENPDLNHLRRAARLIQKGEVIAFPTDTFYGLGADALNPRAVEKVFEIKQRDRKKPILVLVSNFSQASDLVKDVPSEAWRLMSRFWPGPLTLVFVASDKVPDLITAGTGKIGIRVPGDPLTALLLRTVAVPITATSANRSGAASPTTAQELLETLGHEVALILDAGKTPGGMPSTVVDVTTSPITLLREGQIPAAMLK
ncbi:MAG: L-threonylcarbamoyladenylate synthase [Nitrospiria bacterium]